MVFGWLSSKEEVQFGEELAQFFIERIPPAHADGERGVSDKKRQEVIPKMLAKVHAFKVDRTLNVYKKARLGNAFKWKLLDAGYDADWVNEMTKEVLVKL